MLKTGMIKKLFSAVTAFLCITTFRATAASVVVGQGGQAVAGGIVINGHVLSSGGTHDTGVVKQERRELADFHQIDISNFAGKVHIRFGKENIVFVSADSSVIPLIQTEVKGDVLKIGVKKNISTSRPVNLDVQVKNISSLAADGAADIAVEDVKNIENFSLAVSGAASVTAQGHVEKITAVLSGAGKLQGEVLSSEEAVVSVSGSSRAVVNVRKKLTAEASDAGTVLYSGNPVVFKEVRDVGSVKKVK